MARQPKSIKRQIKEANELQKALNTDPTPVVDPDEKPTDVVEQDAAEVIVAKEQPNLDQSGDSPKGEEPKADQAPDWQAKYKGLQTRYNREVPQLRTELDIANKGLDDAKAEVLTLKEQIQNVETQAPAPREVIFSDEEIEQYGEGNIGMMKKVAEQSSGEMAKQIVDLQQTVANLKQGVTNVRETVVVNNERDFRASLARKVKTETGREWLDINDEDGFHNFLAELVPYTNDEKQVYLAKAHSNFDVDAAAKFFIDYAGKKPSSLETDEPLVDDSPGIPEELITPIQSGGGMPPLEEQKVYLTSEIDQFYADKRTGKYKGKESEARKIEQDILAAGKEGRIVNKRQPAYA